MTDIWQHHRAVPRPFTFTFTFPYPAPHLHGYTVCLVRPGAHMSSPFSLAPHSHRSVIAEKLLRVNKRVALFPRAHIDSTVTVLFTTIKWTCYYQYYLFIGQWDSLLSALSLKYFLKIYIYHTLIIVVCAFINYFKSCICNWTTNVKRVVYG